MHLRKERILFIIDLDGADGRLSTSGRYYDHWFVCVGWVNLPNTNEGKHIEIDVRVITPINLYKISVFATNNCGEFLVNQYSESRCFLMDFCHGTYCIDQYHEYVRLSVHFI